MGGAQARPARFYGWVVVGAAFAVLFLAYGLQFSYGVFVTGLAAELGWSRAETVLPYSIYVFCYSALSAATGRATDRFGPRQVITLGAVLLGIGWGTSALVHEPWQLNLTLGVVAALGMSVAWVPCNATVARWFTRRRGAAVAIASTGGSLGNLLVPPLAGFLMATWGWRPALAVIAVVAAFSMLLAARYMVRDPESLGLHPDGDDMPADAPQILAGAQPLPQLRRNLPFLLVVAIYFFTWLVVFVPFVHLPAYAGDLGLGTTAGASLLSAVGLGGVVGRLSSGVVSDYVGRFPALYVTFALQAVSFVAFGAFDDLGGLWLAALAFGFSYGGGVTLLPPLCGDLFGRAQVASVVGSVFAIAGAPAAIGPWVTGWLYDVTGGYAGAFAGAAALNVLALVLTIVLAMVTRRAGAAP
ncbi:MAG: MFS transporter [Gammaproteobacteria bacterium]|nr:MFS transporter [Gammaproteobacteria bacterium]MCP5199534.1 MFS transporter [Gammaproteobacteria bacterium]